MFCQVEKPLAWLRDLNALQNERSASLEYRQAEVTTIRKEVDQWTILHSGKSLDLPSAPEGAWTGEQLNEQIGLLRVRVENIVRDDPSHPGFTPIQRQPSIALLASGATTADRSLVEAIAAIYSRAVPQTSEISLTGMKRDVTLYPAHPVAPDFTRVKAENYVAPEFAEQAIKAQTLTVRRSCPDAVRMKNEN